MDFPIGPMIKKPPAMQDTGVQSWSRRIPYCCCYCSVTKLCPTLCYLMEHSMPEDSQESSPAPQFKSFTSSALSLPWYLSWWRICLKCKRPRFNSWVGKIRCRRDRLPTPVFWPGEFHGLYSPWGHKKESDTTEWFSLSLFSLRYDPTLTSVHDYWQNHTFDYMDLCQQSNVSAF